MIIGSHSIIYSTDPEADRHFFKEVLKIPNIDTGDGWLIFSLPPSELAVHPSSEHQFHEFYLMCSDIDLFVGEMTLNNIRCSKIEDQGWGFLTRVTLPGGSTLGVYEPRHERP